MKRKKGFIHEKTRRDTKRRKGRTKHQGTKAQKGEEEGIIHEKIQWGTKQILFFPAASAPKSRPPSPKNCNISTYYKGAE
jgi:hypothetical protein